MNMTMIMKEDNASPGGRLSLIGDGAGADIKWVWLDLDDTLYDFRGSSDIALGGIYRSRGLGRWFESERQWKDVYHRHNAELWELYNGGNITKEYLKTERFLRPLTEAGADEATALRLSKDMDGEYLRRLAEPGLTVAGARELLMRLREAGKKIGVLSNGFTEVQYDKLRSSSLAELVDCVVLSDEIGVNKPDRRLYDYALAKSGATAGESVMIGDNPATDIAGALGAGWRAILFNPLTDRLLDLVE